jgi:hypothetical protein
MIEKTLTDIKCRGEYMPPMAAWVERKTGAIQFIINLKPHSLDLVEQVEIESRLVLS